MELANLRFIFFFTLAAFISSLSANISDFDEVWRRRAKEAMNDTIEAYDPNHPEDVTNHFNMHVHKSEGDLLMNGATFNQSGYPHGKTTFSKKEKIKAKPGRYVTRLTRFSGALYCFPG